MVTIDIDAYLSVPQYRKYLKFLWKGRCWSPSAPRVFTKLLKPVDTQLSLIYMMVMRNKLESQSKSP